MPTRPMSRRAVPLLLATLAAASLTLAQPVPPTPPATQPVFLTPVPDPSVLPNARYVTAKVISGGAPEGDPGFAELRSLGIKTIVTVDGAKPDVASAKRFGMRYVHLPISYNGITPDQTKSIAKALEDLPGPIYIHCHHGKHRSAAACAVACVANGSLPPDKALDVLKTFGTGENYKGLWQAAANARPLPQRVIENYKVTFVETQPIAPLAETMVHVDERFDHIKAIRKSEWLMPKDNPDLDPPHEALQLDELLREIPRTDPTVTTKPDFQRLITTAEHQAAVLRDALATTPPNRTAAESAYTALAANCNDCHKLYRDTPTTLTRK